VRALRKGCVRVFCVRSVSATCCRRRSSPIGPFRSEVGFGSFPAVTSEADPVVTLPLPPREVGTIILCRRQRRCSLAWCPYGEVRIPQVEGVNARHRGRIHLDAVTFRHEGRCHR
jgi:hypothetical protein